MMTRISLLLVLTASTVFGCAVQTADESSPDYRLPAGTELVLRETLVVPAGSARVFLQRGAVVAKARLDYYNPHCNFELREVSDGTARIEPDVFFITRVTVGFEEVVGRELPHYAGVGLPTFDDMRPFITRYVRHDLNSAVQPQVMRMTCHGGFDDSWWAELPTLNEIRAALGTFATVQLR